MLWGQGCPVTVVPRSILCFWRLLKEMSHIGWMNSAAYLLCMKLHFKEKIGWGRNKAYFVKNFRVELSVCGFSFFFFFF